MALEAVQPVGRLVLPSKSEQISAPPQPPELELDEELLELLDEELDELELLLELLDEELLELDDDELVLPELEPPPQADRAQVARMIGIKVRMLVWPQFIVMNALVSAAVAPAVRGNNEDTLRG